VTGDEWTANRRASRGWKRAAGSRRRCRTSRALERAKDGDDGSDARGEAARRRGQQLVQWEGCKVQGARSKEQGARCVSGRWHDDRADRYGWRRIEWRRGVDADD
jgi:hypothetical protein